MEKEKDERRPMQTLPSAPELVSCLSSHIKCAVPDCFMQSADLQKERENHSLEDSLKTMLLLGSGGNSATAEKETYHLAVQVRRPPTRHLAFGGVVGAPKPLCVPTETTRCHCCSTTHYPGVRHYGYDHWLKLPAPWV